jgi:DHA1 family bicyclomycin/chloramphenicol resistance-like MFS transporter
MPAVTPILGGHIMVWMNWRAIFGFLLVVFAVYLIIAFRRLPATETEPVSNAGVTTKQLLGTYGAILRDTRYWGYTLPYAAATGGLIGYYSAMPFWYHLQFGIDDHVFSYLAIPTVSLYIIGLVCAAVLIKKMDLERILFLGMLAACGTAVATLVLVIFQISGLIGIVGIFSLFGFAAGLIAPNSNAGVLAEFKKVAAPTSALVSVALFGTASLTSTVAMNLYVKDSLGPVLLYLAVLSAGGLAAGYFWLWRPYRMMNTPSQRSMTEE